MRRIFYILAILLLPCMTTAWANSTREITIKWELDSDPDNKKSLIREYTVTDTSGRCTTDNATYKIQNAKSEKEFKCPGDITSIPLAFEFHTHNSPFKNFSETIQITDKKNYKIEKTLEYRGNDNILTGTNLQLCKTEISSLLSEYCDDEGYTTGKNTISAPSYGGFMIGDDHRTITAGCYKFKKNNSTEKMRKKIAKKCNVPVSDVKIETFTRPTNDVKKNAEQTTTVPEKTKNTISGTLMLRNAKSGDYNTEPCKNCQILMNSRQIGTTNNDGKFNLEVSDQNAKITFKYNDDYETKTLTASEFSNSGNTKITLTPIPSASTQASPAQTDTTYTELKKDIFGYVKDLNNEPIIGAAVQILNSKNNNSQCGITTNIYGYWIISECQELPQNAQLQISSIGYKTKKISLASHKNRATITLEEENIPLDAVEVVACKTTNDKYPGGTEFKPADEQGLCGTDTDNPCDDGHKCIPTKCDETKYKLDYPNTLSAKCAEKECKPENAKSGKWTGTAGNWVCEVNECNDGFKKEDSNKKCIPMLKECTTEQLREHPNALETGIEPGTENCIALTCKCEYDLKDKRCEAWPATGKKCNSSTDPELPKNAKLAYMACKDNNKYCKIEECEINFKPNEDKTECISLKGECNPKPENAKKTHREFDDKTQTEICIIDECKKDFELSADKKSCVKIAKPKLSREDSQKKIDELQENADAMHDKEHSTANKLLGGAAIGATGIGAMQALSAYSEQQS
ncbi:MAG: carboxypeptidase-like regulatory domain-containing protein, partial [Alphaproteobacteria bacterium]|nr:carboxypeptidase-like regulatory domain-containing protein [Alphaproteobacteria bacterium]